MLSDTSSSPLISSPAARFCLTHPAPTTPGPVEPSLTGGSHSRDSWCPGPEGDTLNRVSILVQTPAPLLHWCLGAGGDALYVGVG
ncbi:MAG: hypothetical protein K0A89_10035 [ANME-2 cluster archaeon]|nr:hypothetical protein [ANME-2 cluster archaeon]